ncbi:Outer membrane efflux protein BepC [BD1-7 clade bacterium]|uniref:Outer membrane efflux protein BepC n=1 Tax=BD1-7 clade bacterium TaxID=2029982 RepID=A0A5S9P488_9GAMM|nr:Outer membrane efflux protein BepC [BD1-7 clade bacterium]CAA0098215.1 Outer membrane efflux protein BepC [BD1-7 clade bacterium]
MKRQTHTVIWTMIVAGMLLIASMQSRANSGITLREAFALAYKSNPAMRAAEAGYEATTEIKSQALSTFWQPQISVSGDVALERIDQKVNADLDTITHTDEKTVGLNIDYPLFSGGQNQAAGKVADYTINAAEFSVDQTQQTLFLNVTHTFAAIQLTRKTLRFLQEEAKAAENLIRDNRNKLARKLATRVDVARAQQQLSAISVQIDQQLGLLRAANHRFAIITGTRQQPVDQWPTLTENRFSETDAVERSLNNNPQLQAQKASVEASKYFVKQNEGALLPQLGLSYQATYVKDAARYASSGSFDELGYETTQVVTLSVSVPLYLGGNTYSLVRQAKKKAVEAYYQMLDLQNTIVSGAYTAHTQLSTSQKNIQQTAQDVSYAQAIIEGLQVQYRNRQVTVKDVIEARNTYLEARIQHQQAFRRLLLSEAKLLSTMGILTLSYLDTGDDHKQQAIDRKSPSQYPPQ